MPFITTPALEYALLAFDRDGVEAHDPDGAPTSGRPKRTGAVRRAVRRLSDRTFAGQGHIADPPRTVRGERRLMSAELTSRLRAAEREARPYTDLFVASHGWLTDYQRALRTYNAWFEACVDTRPVAALAAAGDYRPLVVAVHWPSEPNTLADRHAEDPIPLEEVPDVPAPVQRRKGLVGLLRSLVPLASFSVMKRRSAVVGRTGVASVLAALQRTGGDDLRVHLLGHSFGAKLVAETLTDRRRKGVRPVESLFLVEGALSAWSFSAAEDNPYGDPAGTATRILDHGMVRGPIVASTSRFDHALSRMFPAAQAVEVAFRRIRTFRWPFGRLRVAGDPSVAPRLGAIGIWSFAGVRGLRTATLRRDTSTDYDFRPGAVHHLVTDAVIDLEPYHGMTYTDPMAGSHSNIAHPELAAAWWQAVLAGRRSRP